MRSDLLKLLVLTLALLAAPLAMADEFSARLGRTPVDARNQASITGQGSASAELDGDRLTIEGRFAGLQGPATTANLHLGAAVGVRGPVIHPLELTTAAEGEIRASLRLSPAERDALRAGRLYIQINSEPAADGNLWGWLLAD